MHDQNNPKNEFNEVSPDINPIEVEKTVREYWGKSGSFMKSIDALEGNNSFVFYDGPPFANGLPHYGHLLTSFIKDCFARYKTMMGMQTHRKFGWDCHGLPAEMEAEKTLGISGKTAIEEYGIDNFNQKCRSDVMKYSDSWKEYIERAGRWVDFDGYKTMDSSFMESVIWGFNEMYKKGLVYQAYRVMPYSWKCQTPLSNFETKLDNAYRQKETKSVTVKFKIDEGEFKGHQFLVWTTTPWTLPSNLALAVGDGIEYSIISHDGEFLILATSSLGRYKITPENVVKTVKGDKLKGIKYTPIMPFFQDTHGAFKVLLGDFVTTEDGTGIVHLAPGFGEDDQRVCGQNGIEVICPVDEGGRFDSRIFDIEYSLNGSPEVLSLSGRCVMEEKTNDKGVKNYDGVNEDIIKYLKSQNSWFLTEQYLHNYPHCWRTDTPLIYKAVPSWYIEVEKIKDRMVELNKDVNWIPSHIRDGQFGKWLENARDWSISRNRFWGSPIPIWQSDDPNYPRIDVYGSIDEIKRDFAESYSQLPEEGRADILHRPWVDRLTRANPNDPSGKSKMVRCADVFDCWFESGSMPFASVNYPFSNKDWFEANFPADFIVEYVAQTRGWFYTMTVVGVALFDKIPFKNCICHGVILDEKGQKLSKRLQNYPDPMDVFDQYGSDAMRWFMLSSPVMNGGNLLVKKDANDIRDVVRLVIKPILNSYKFFSVYANADGVSVDDIKAYSGTSNFTMDVYILSKLAQLQEKFITHMDEYNTIDACREILGFIDVLNNWYIRRNKERFWSENKQNDSSKMDAYKTLYDVLVNFTKIISPVLPFTAELLYLNLA